MRTTRKLGILGLGLMLMTGAVAQAGPPARPQPDHHRQQNPERCQPRDERGHHQGGWHGGHRYGHGSSPSMRFGNSRFSFSITLGSPSYRSGYSYYGGGCRPEPYREPIIVILGNGYRLYQPGVRGHSAFIQRWCPVRCQWITVRSHPSIY